LVGDFILAGDASSFYSSLGSTLVSVTSFSSFFGDSSGKGYVLGGAFLAFGCGEGEAGRGSFSILMIFITFSTA
jgi:hypothetical protein